jgi:hypothetical protein
LCLNVKFHFLPGFFDFLTVKSFDFGWVILLIRYLLINYICLLKRMQTRQMLRQRQKPIETNPCIICLNETPVTKQCDSPCQCKPHIHQRCINGWFRLNPNECPICRINYEDMPEEDVLPTLCERFRRNHLRKFCRGAFAMSFSYLSFVLIRGLISGPNGQAPA